MPPRETPSLRSRDDRKTYPPEKLHEILSQIYPDEIVNDLMPKLMENAEEDTDALAD